MDRRPGPSLAFAQGKVSVSPFVNDLGLRPQDAGDLAMAHWLEWAGLLSMGLGRNGVGSFDISLGINNLG
jgi:8-hydroxy-5-deazaflavin:NADPH oxidoreductase